MTKLIPLALLTFSLSTFAKEYFPKDYISSRAEFRLQSQKADGEIEYGFFHIPSQVDPDLTIDYFYKHVKEASSIVLLTSGVHGVEAFAGAAVQNLAFDKILPKYSERKDVSFLFVHSINPYGFKYLRRVSENNVDLNRNFATSPELFKLKNPGYAEVRKLLNPTQSVSLSSFRYYFSFVEMIWQIATKGMKPLRQAVLQGQYEYPKGLYFGGQNPEPQGLKLLSFLQEKLSRYKKILAIDIHTGYGEKNKLHLFGPTGLNALEQETLKTVFTGYSVDTGDDEDFYKVHGDFTQFIAAQAPKNSIFIPMTFEYGTLDSQTSMGALKSISNMIVENQGHHHGYTTQSDQNKVRERFQEMYYPQSPKWRNAVIQQADKLLPKSIENFTKL